jgi:hypothetical protein
MSNDRDLAKLLGEAPPDAPDPGFRFDVFALMTRRTRRRAALDRALNRIAIFAGIGLIFPVAQAAGLSADAVAPVLLVGGVLAAAFVAAFLAIQGPRLAWARSSAALRRPLLRA